MHKDGYWTEVRLKNKLTEVEREFFEVMTRRRQPHRAHLPRLSICEAPPRAPLRTFFEKKVLRTPKNF